MKRVTVIFVSAGFAQAKGWKKRLLAFLHRRIGGVVRFCTRSKWAHVSVAFDKHMIEALGGGVTWEKKGKYDNEPILKKIEIPVSERQYRAMYAEAKRCIGLRYGLLDDCVVGLVHDVAGDHAADRAEKLLDSAASINCSGLATRIFRAAFPGFMDGHGHAQITPEGAVRPFTMLYNRQMKKYSGAVNSGAASIGGEK